MTAGISRRTALIALAGAGAGAGLWFLVGREPALRHPEDPRIATALDWLSDPKAVRRAGRSALKVLPQPVDSQSLISQLVSDPRWDGDRPIPELFAEQISEDFRAGRVVRIEGWVLSETEAKLFALTQLEL